MAEWSAIRTWINTVFDIKEVFLPRDHIKGHVFHVLICFSCVHLHRYLSERCVKCCSVEMFSLCSSSLVLSFLFYRFESNFTSVCKQFFFLDVCLCFCTMVLFQVPEQFFNVYLQELEICTKIKAHLCFFSFS